MKHGSTSVISSPPPLPPTIEGEHLLQLLKISLAGKEGKGSNSLPSHPIEIGHFKLSSYILQTLLNILPPESSLPYQRSPMLKQNYTKSLVIVKEPNMFQIIPLKYLQA